MAVKTNRTWRRSSILALAIAALAVPSVAMADPDDGGRGGWRSSGENRGSRGEGNWQPRQQQAPQAQAPQQMPQRTWSAPVQQAPQQTQRSWSPPQGEAQARSQGWNGGNRDGGNRDGGNRAFGWGGGNRERSATWNGGERTAPVPPAQVPQQVRQGPGGWGGSDQGNWRGRTDRRERGGNWQGSTQAQTGTWNGTPIPQRREGTEWRQRVERQDRPNWGSRDGDRYRRDGNGTFGWNANTGDRYRDRDHDRDRDRDYWRNRSWSHNHWDQSRRNWSGWNNNWNWNYGSDYRRWNRTWRNNNRYDWYGWRSYHPSYFQVGAYYAPYRGYSYSRLSIGFFLDSLFFGDDYWIADPGYYRLPEVYGPYRWIRYYDDAVLVDIYSGEVVDVIYDFFW